MNNDKNNNQADDSDSKFTKLHCNAPFFDFKHAENTLGVDFEFISEDGFKEFLEDKYLNLLVDLRNTYLKKDYKTLDEHAHKIKGAFV
jgi:hypothetical protein